MVVTGFYTDANRMSLQAKPEGGNPYRGLVAAIILQAIRDWEACCAKCAKGQLFNFPDCNFAELERFFTQVAPKYIMDDWIDPDAMFEQLLKDKEDAFRQRERKGFTHYGAELRAQRERLGLSRRELANLSGFTIDQIERWEKGISQPYQRHKNRLEAVLAAQRLPQ